MYTKARKVRIIAVFPCVMLLLKIRFLLRLSLCRNSLKYHVLLMHTERYLVNSFRNDPSLLKNVRQFFRLGR